jgi:hypothetical protein
MAEGAYVIRSNRSNVARPIALFSLPSFLSPGWVVFRNVPFPPPPVIKLGNSSIYIVMIYDSLPSEEAYDHGLKGLHVIDYITYLN